MEKNHGKVIKLTTNLTNHRNISMVEEDNNRVNSNKTSVVNKKNASKVAIPPFTRYQMMIQLEQDTNEAAIDEEKEGDTSPLKNI